MAMFGTTIQDLVTLFLRGFVDFRLLLASPCGFGGILSMRFKTSSRSSTASRLVKRKTSIS
jgi:hypothetical protein